MCTLTLTSEVITGFSVYVYTTDRDKVVLRGVSERVETSTYGVVSLVPECDRQVRPD